MRTRDDSARTLTDVQSTAACVSPRLHGRRSPLERAPKGPHLLHHSPGGRRGSNWPTVHSDKVGPSGQSRVLVGSHEPWS